MKKIIALLVILCIGVLAGCGQIVNSQETSPGNTETNTATAETSADDTETNAPDHQTVVTVVAPKSPATIPVLRMIENDCMGENIKLDLQLYGDMEAMMALASGGDYGILIVPVHTAANLKNKGIDVKMVNAFGWGGMYLSTTDPDCSSWKDLDGKELYVPAKGSVPDIMTQYFLSQNGLELGKNVEVVYSSHAEIAQLIAAGTIQYAVDAQPFVTSNLKNVDGYRVISEFAEDWKLTQGEAYSMPGNCTVVNSDYLSENESVVLDFNKKFSDAIRWTVENPDEAGALANTYLNANAELIAAAMPGFCLDYKSAADARNDVEEYFKVLLELKPESIGDKIPDESFYYTSE